MILIQWLALGWWSWKFGGIIGSSRLNLRLAWWSWSSEGGEVAPKRITPSDNHRQVRDGLLHGSNGDGKVIGQGRERNCQKHVFECRISPWAIHHTFPPLLTKHQMRMKIICIRFYVDIFWAFCLTVVLALPISCIIVDDLLFSQFVCRPSAWTGCGSILINQ